LNYNQHFHQNRLAKQAQSRRWYHRVTDWKQCDDGCKLFVFGSQHLQMKPNQSSQPSCVAPQVGAKCKVYYETFETFFHDEDDDWHLRIAILVEGKTFHPFCFADFKPSLTVDDADVDETNNSNDFDVPLHLVIDETVTLIFNLFPFTKN